MALSMSTAIGTAGLLFFPALSIAQQQATVERNVNLRSRPTTASQVIELLPRGTTLTLLAPESKKGFYSVKAEDGNDGWVWAKSVSVSAEAPAPEAAAPVAAEASTECDATLWKHVYNPGRLIVKQQCISVTGTVVDATKGKRHDGVRHEGDGDTHGWVALDPEFKHLLNAGNMSDEGGNLVFEVVCEFPVTQADAKTACPKAYHSAVEIPAVGSHVRIVGTYVQDTNHAKWMEIHPVTSITVMP